MSRCDCRRRGDYRHCQADVPRQPNWGVSAEAIPRCLRLSSVSTVQISLLPLALSRGPALTGSCTCHWRCPAHVQPFIADGVAFLCAVTSRFLSSTHHDWRDSRFDSETWPTPEHLCNLNCSVSEVQRVMAVSGTVISCSAHDGKSSTNNLTQGWRPTQQPAPRRNIGRRGMSPVSQTIS